MSISRSSLFLSKRFPRLLLQRFGRSRQIHSRSHVRSAEKGNSRAGNQPLLEEGQGQASSRSRIPYLIPAALLGIGGFVSFLHYNDERRSIAKGSGEGNCGCNNNSVTGPIIGGPFALVNTENQIITEKDFQGKWVLLYFGYTSSPDVGPEQIQLLAKAVGALESKENLRILPVCVTIDPHRDTPAQLRAYLKEFDSRILGLTGPDNAVRQMAQEYRIFFKRVEEEGGDYLVESSHNMYLLNPKMEVIRCFGTEYTSEELAKDIKKEIQKFSG